MPMTRKELAVELLICGAIIGGGCGGAVYLYLTSEPPYRYAEFACYDDGVETERHVGIVTDYNNGTTWKFEYEEGTRGTYSQKPGETCQIEVKPQ